jgi:hypothetical protein
MPFFLLELQAYRQFGGAGATRYEMQIPPWSLALSFADHRRRDRLAGQIAVVIKGPLAPRGTRPRSPIDGSAR